MGQVITPEMIGKLIKNAKTGQIIGICDNVDSYFDVNIRHFSHLKKWWSQEQLSALNAEPVKVGEYMQLDTGVIVRFTGVAGDIIRVGNDVGVWDCPVTDIARVVVAQQGKHPHAELMLAYAQDALKSAEPWKLWERRISGQTEWESCGCNPSWISEIEYRRKPVPNYTPVKETIEFIKPIKNVDDLVGIDILYVVDRIRCSHTLKVTSVNINEVKTYHMESYDVNHLIQNNDAFATKEHAQQFIDAYDLMKTYMR